MIHAFHLIWIAPLLFIIGYAAGATFRMGKADEDPQERE